MTDHAPLERRYRRLLALYPHGFRDEHQEEMLSVLLAGAGADQAWPRPGEAADLIRRALGLRVRAPRIPGTWERRHARVMFPVRLLIGTWLVFLTTIMYASGVGGWWGALLVPAAALHFWFAYRLRPPGRAA